MNCLGISKRTQVVAALVEGASINSIVRMTGVSKPTILKLLHDVARVLLITISTFTISACAVCSAMRFGHSLAQRIRMPALKRKSRGGETFGHGRPLMPIQSYRSRVDVGGVGRSS